MKNRKSVAERLFRGKKLCSERPVARYRTLAIEPLESRALLNASVTVVGRVRLDSDEGMGVPNARALVQVPVIYTLGTTTVRATLSGHVFTDGVGAFQATESAPNGATNLHFDPSGAILVRIQAMSPSVWTNDPDDLGPAYRVADPNGVVYATSFYVPVASVGPIAQNNASVNPVITASASAPNVRDAFEAFAVVYPYNQFMTGDLQVAADEEVSVIYPYTTHNWSEFNSDNPSNLLLDLTAASLASDVKILGHEYGHYCAYEAGFINAADGDHGYIANERLYNRPGLVTSMTPFDQELAYNEGFADWFAVSGAVHESTIVSAMSGLPGFGPDQLTTLDGQSLSDAGGGGEDTEASVAKILWSLESDPLFAAQPGGATSEEQVFQAASACTTLYGLWQNLLDGANYDTCERMEALFARQGVAPVASGVQWGAATVTFQFSLPMVGLDPPAPNDPVHAAFTFDNFTITLFGADGTVVYSEDFNVKPNASNERPKGDALAALGLVQDSFAITTSNHGGSVDLTWTPTEEQWYNILIGSAHAGGLKDWTVTGTTNVGGSASGAVTQYTSVNVPLNAASAQAEPVSFTATSPGNNTLDLAYNIYTPGTGPGGTLTSLTVTLYASASGLFYDPNNVQAASPYVYNDNNNGGAWLSGSDQKVLSLDGGGLTPSLLEQYATFSDGWNMSDFYILAEINTTSSDTDSNTYSDTQWVRLQVGAFQNGGAVYVMGTASLDNPTPDVQATDTFTITGSGRTNPYYTVVSGPADDGTGDTFTRNFGGSLYVEARTHAGSDTVDASGFTGNEDCGPLVMVLDGSGNDTIYGEQGCDVVQAGAGGYSFTESRGGVDDFVFAGDSPLSPVTINEASDACAYLDFTYLGAGVNLDVGSGGNLGGPVSLTPRDGEGTRTQYYYDAAYAVAA